jgi:hypothetical protein
LADSVRARDSRSILHAKSRPTLNLRTFLIGQFSGRRVNF